MLKEAVLTTLNEAVAVEGYKAIANEIPIAKTTLWRILTKGAKPSPDQEKKIITWFSGHPRKEDISADGPTPKTEQPITEAELLRQKICKEVSCITSVSTLQTISLILSRQEGMTVTIKLQNGGPR